jgi:WD40 repeat protein/serine/threonine protein kinase
MNEESIFAAAITKTPEERGAFLDDACGSDQELRARVEALLEAHDSPDSFLDSPAPNLKETSGRTPVTGRPGTQIGPYKLLQQIGEGGFGVVYMAEQREPVRRKVALKIIKPGMDTRQVIARFEAERQALSLMEHPNIARVFDAGATDSGRPYFVMELVRGVPITEYCDKNDLSTEKRLELSVAVCRAVQHAHQKGIIHRDIKPSNIMVTLHDGMPVPKIIDFGVSKAISQHLTEKTLFTAYGQMVGTPQYMSPEQAEMSGLDVDTRSDVYSLGVLLYELLTGTTPLEAERLHAAGYAEIQRIIREEEPPRPSVRLSTSSEELTVIAKHRSVDPRGLQRLVRGELDWIVMKSLEKDRGRRYESPSALADDVGRFLANEAVQACPPSMIYRIRKFVRRNKVAVAAAIAVLLTLILGITGTSIGMLRAWREAGNARLALQGEKHAREAEGTARRVAEREKERAEDEAEKKRRLLYIADMNLARQAWEENNVGRVLRILERHMPKPGEPDLRGFEWRHLWRLCRRTLEATVVAGSYKSHKVAFSPDGKTLAVGYLYGRVDLFDVASCKRTQSLGEGRDEVYPFVAYSPDGRMIAIPSSDCSAIVVRDLSSGSERLLTGHSGPVHEVAFSKDSRLLASASGDRTVRIWDLIAGGEPSILRGHESEVWSVAFSPDGGLVATGTDADTIRLWDLETIEELACIVGSPSKPPNEDMRRVWSVAFSLDGKLLAAGCGDWSIRIVDPATGQVVRVLQGHSDEVRSVAFSPDRRTLASASRDSTVKLWDLQTYGERETLKGFAFGGHACAFPRGGTTLASAGVDYRVLLWDTTTESEADAVKLEGAATCTDWGYSIAFLSDETLLISLVQDTDGFVSAWSGVDEKKHVETTTVEPVQQIAVSKNGVMALGVVGAIELHDVRSNKKLASFKLREQVGVTALAFSSDCRRLAAGCADGSIEILDTEESQNDQSALLGHKSAVTCLSFSKDGLWLASGDRGGGVAVWDANAGEVISWLDGHRDRVMCVAFSPDRTKLATGALEHSRSLCVWNVSSATPHPAVLMAARSVYSVTFSSDGTTLFAAHGDNAVRLWDVASGHQRLALLGHTCAVHALALSSDENTLVSVDRYGTARLWRAACLEEVEALRTSWKHFADRERPIPTSRSGLQWAVPGVER